MKRLYTLYMSMALCMLAFMPTRAQADDACIQAQDYWTNNLDIWPEPFTPDSQICSNSFIDILQFPTGGEPWRLLAKNWIVATLNVASGAPSDCLGTVLCNAEDLLNRCDFSSNPDNLECLVSYVATLSDYNNGLLEGCLSCGNGVVVFCPPCPQCPDFYCPDVYCPECPDLFCPDCNCDTTCPDCPACNCVFPEQTVKQVQQKQPRRQLQQPIRFITPLPSTNVQKKEIVKKKRTKPKNQ